MCGVVCRDNYLSIGARELVTERGVQQTLMFVKHTLDPTKTSASYFALASNGFNFTPALPDQYLNAPLSLFDTWKSDGSGHYASFYASSMLKYILIIFVSHKRSETTIARSDGIFP